MDLIMQTSVVTAQANGIVQSFYKGDRVRWPDRADAERLIKAGFAKPADPEPSKR
jgi:hypothetical protein